MVVQHNLQAMNSNRMLGLTVKAQSKSTEKLSSGYKINRAADDAAGLSISEKMRKQIRGLTQASLNAQDGISAVQTAEGALHEVQDMLQRMNELAVKAANGTNSSDDRNYIQDEIDQLLTEIDRVAETTKFNETYLLKGDSNKTSTVYGYGRTAATIQTVAAVPAGKQLFNAAGTTLSAEAVKAALDNGEKLYSARRNNTAACAKTDLAAACATNVNASDYFKLTADLYDATGKVAVKAGEIVSKNFVTKSLFTDTAGTKAAGATIGAVNAKEGVTVATKNLYNADGTIKYAAGAEVSKEDVENIAKLANAVGNAAEAVLGKDFIVVEPELYDRNGNKIAANGLENYFGVDSTGTVVYEGGLFDSNGKEVGTVGKELTNTLNADLQKYVSQSQTGIGDLSFKLHVGADGTSNNQIKLNITAMDSKSLGIDEIKVNGLDDTNALEAIEMVKAAIQTISTQRSALGAVQNRLEHTINNLDNVVENTTAAESQIRDTDMATEMVRYSNNNILAQAGQAMLAQANQSNQGVLSLLG